MASDSDTEEEDDQKNNVIEEVEEDLSEFTFIKFASTYFVSTTTYSFSKRIIREPLLHHDDEIEKNISLSIWTSILRFMGELAEAKDWFTSGLGPEHFRFRPSALPVEL